MKYTTGENAEIGDLVELIDHGNDFFTQEFREAGFAIVFRVGITQIHIKHPDITDTNYAIPITVKFIKRNGEIIGEPRIWHGLTQKEK